MFITPETEVAHSSNTMNVEFTSSLTSSASVASWAINTAKIRIFLCPATCISCNTNMECSSCKAGTFLVNNNCISTCPDGQYGDLGTKTCKSCNVANCRECSNDGITCLKCNTGKFLLNNVCENDCPTEGYFKDTTDNVCKSCEVTDCKDCSLSASTCKLCNPNLFYYENKC